MKIENIDRVNEIVDRINQLRRLIDSVNAAAYIYIRSQSGSSAIDAPLAAFCDDLSFYDLAKKFQEDVIDRMNSEISDLEDELETL